MFPDEEGDINFISSKLKEISQRLNEVKKNYLNTPLTLNMIRVSL